MYLKSYGIKNPISLLSGGKDDTQTIEFTSDFHARFLSWNNDNPDFKVKIEINKNGQLTNLFDPEFADIKNLKQNQGNCFSLGDNGLDFANGNKVKFTVIAGANPINGLELRFLGDDIVAKKV